MQHAHINDRFLAAAARGDLAAIRLASSEPDFEPNAATPDHHGDNALHLACVGGHPEAVRLLIALGTDPNAQNHAGVTPMHLCVSDDAEHCHPKCLNALLECGKADSSIRDARGLTSEQLARQLMREWELKGGRIEAGY